MKYTPTNINNSCSNNSHGNSISNKWRFNRCCINRLDMIEKGYLKEK